MQIKYWYAANNSRFGFMIWLKKNRKEATIDKAFEVRV
jgi:hypothetical protein